MISEVRVEKRRWTIARSARFVWVGGQRTIRVDIIRRVGSTFVADHVTSTTESEHQVNVILAVPLAVTVDVNVPWSDQLTVPGLPARVRENLPPEIGANTAPYQDTPQPPPTLKKVIALFETVKSRGPYHSGLDETLQSPSNGPLPAKMIRKDVSFDGSPVPLALRALTLAKYISCR